MKDHDQAATDGGEDLLWQRFRNTATVEDFCSTWLALQCRKLDGIAGGVVLLGAPGGGPPFGPVAFWPDRRLDVNHLIAASERAVAERRGVSIKRSDANGSSDLRYDLAYPLQASGQIYGVVALEAESLPQEALRQAMRQLQWGSGWMGTLFYHRQLAASSRPQERSQAVFSILAGIVSHHSFQGAALELVSGLATRFDCDRVSIGFLKQGRVRVAAVSHSAEVGADTNLTRAVVAAMEEALDQRESVVIPAARTNSMVTADHLNLAIHGGNGAVCSVPLRGPAGTTGVITFERAESRPFDPDTVRLLESICTLAGPVLELQRREDRWLHRKVMDALNAQVRALIGPRRVAMKLSVFVIAAAALFLAIADGNYRVTAKALIEPASRQAIVAAYDGFVSNAPLRAGDLVQKDQVLAQLDDRELKLERSRWQSQQEQSLRQYYEALGNRNAAQVQIFNAQVAQARAQVALLDEEIARTKVTAPLDGVIVTGDLSQALGAPVERGQVLFELAPLDAYRITLQVDEHQIGQVVAGQHGRLVLAGFADHPLDFSVRRLTPVSTSTDGRNFFRVEAALEHVPEQLRPGMEGVGKIEIDRRRLLWIWTHELRDWLRLKTWNWLP